MAVSQIEEKILGRLAKQAAASNPLLSASLYQVLGLSILLSRKLYRARKVRKLDTTRDTKSLQLYHHIIWLAREGLSITEVYILPYCQNGEQGPECRVMAAKLRASLYHIFCLFHNHPPIGQGSPRSSPKSGSGSNGHSPKGKEKEEDRRRSNKSPKTISESGRRRRRASKQALRDPIPSVTSDTSYITNPYAPAPAITPSPTRSADAGRTPTRPPGLIPINIGPAQAAASFLLPALNFVPMASEYFATAQHLADTLLHAAHALRLSISLEHAAFTWECSKEHEQARQLARRAIVEVYQSTEGLDDDEYADAVPFVQALGGIYRRGSNDSTPRISRHSPRSEPPSRQAPVPPIPPPGRVVPPIDRTIAVSPSYRRRVGSPAQARSSTRTPERLSTVPEDPSQETLQTAPTTLSPSASRNSTRSKQRRGSSASGSSDKASKRRAAEEAEELYRQNSARSARSRGSSDQADRSHSRQSTPPDGYVRKPSPTLSAMRAGGNI